VGEPYEVEESEVGQCLMQEARAIVFPAQEASLRFGIPMMLEPERKEPAPMEPNATPPPGGRTEL
jgi:hypothetical protein